jgi:hypothetical protein
MLHPPIAQYRKDIGKVIRSTRYLHANSYVLPSQCYFLNVVLTFFMLCAVLVWCGVIFFIFCFMCSFGVVSVKIILSSLVIFFFNTALMANEPLCDWKRTSMATHLYGIRTSMAFATLWRRTSMANAPLWRSHLYVIGNAPLWRSHLYGKCTSIASAPLCDWKHTTMAFAPLWWVHLP